MSASGKSPAGSATLAAEVKAVACTSSSTGSMNSTYLHLRFACAIVPRGAGTGER